MNKLVYTIGHSNVASERLLELLRQHEITAVADVRSQPYSRVNPQFNRENIEAFLKKSSVEYVYLGRELGARSEDPACYREGKAQYTLMAQTPLFQSGLDRLYGGMERFRVALMCAEKDPLGCHRTILVARRLHEQGVTVQHILEDGSTEDHESLLLRLLAAHGLQEDHLFHTREERIAMAYDLQANEIQYTADRQAQPA